MFVAGWLDGFRMIGGWWDGFRVLALSSGWVQAVVILVLIAVMFTPFAFKKSDTKRGKNSKDEDDGVVYGHRVLWDE